MQNFRNREVTPLTKEDCLLVFDRVKDHFDFPIHYHPEYEINYVCNADKAQRAVGDSLELIDDTDLVLIGSYLQHGWIDGEKGHKNIREITIQFHKDLFHPSLLERNIMRKIDTLLKKSAKGIKFSKQTIKQAGPYIEKLVKTNGTNTLVELIHILGILAESDNYRLLSSGTVNSYKHEKNEQFKTICLYIGNNFHQTIKLEDIAAIHNMTTSTFSRLIKRETGKSFIEYLNDFRISHTARQLVETNLSITEIAFNSGFNNLANFNRIFRKIKGCTPTEYKTKFKGAKRIL
uniref:AraC family transcriptional regulator n=1 Tax=uncultured Draconibacterium sp. TaxID=1573823 RepID=UPI0032169E88